MEGYPNLARRTMALADDLYSALPNPTPKTTRNIRELREAYIDRAAEDNRVSMRTVNAARLDIRRRQIADEVYENYDFGAVVEDSDDWEHGGQNTYTKSVYLEQEDGPTNLVRLVITFVSDHTTLASAEVL